MRRALQFAAVALYTVLAGTASVAHAAGLAGSTVITTLYNPSLATVLGGPTSATVGANTPTYPSGSINGNTAFQINVTSTQIVYNPLVSVTYGNGPFNGFVFNFAGSGGTPAPDVAGSLPSATRARHSGQSPSNPPAGKGCEHFLQIRTVSIFKPFF